MRSALFRFGTYNLLNLEIPTTPQLQQRYNLIIGNIRRAYQGRTGVLGIQELLGDTKADARRLIRRIAHDTGMCCEAIPARRHKAIPALASQAAGASANRFHVGLLWTPDIEPIPGTLRAYEGGSDFWHGLVAATFRAGGPVPTRWCSYHADPFRPERRLWEAHRVLSVFQDPAIPGGVAADWNGLSADRRPRGEYYDPEPYLEQNHRKLRYQVTFDPKDPNAPKLANRDAGEFLRRDPGGLRDTAAVLDVPWQWSCGHWVDAKGRPDDFGQRRIDTLRVTADIAATTRTHLTHDGPDAEAASDHLMVTADFALHELAVMAA
ncbi:hypothetical protein [Streptomyces bluensis]|uniref:hypothetical protein n=1 Tax=Streptomyces bluensis TaxID=33897 RepID=UPI001676B30C|nr:hypothetical protein [Streptomyces bluensis]GGZ93018.1 hypothetical protein GCM10010344_71000 [Streptomyces bluensis]